MMNNPAFVQMAQQIGAQMMQVGPRWPGNAAGF